MQEEFFEKGNKIPRGNVQINFNFCKNKNHALQVAFKGSMELLKKALNVFIKNEDNPKVQFKIPNAVSSSQCIAMNTKNFYLFLKSFHATFTFLIRF